MTTPDIALDAVHMRQADFESELLSICGDVRLLWMPTPSDTTTSTSKDRNERTVTYSESIQSFDDAGAKRLGNGYYVTFNGTDEEADTPHVAGLSFGDGAVDEPFSILSLVKPDANDTSYIIVAKEASASDQEWRFLITSSGYPQMALRDESSSGEIVREDQTAIGTDWVLAGATYDGSGTHPGIGIWVDAVKTDDASQSSGDYTAMEAGASTVQIAHRFTTPAIFFDGSLAFVLVTAKELTADEQWQIKTLVNEFYNLSL